MGSIIRQHRETDYSGNFIRRPLSPRSQGTRNGPQELKSAFDDQEQYELTQLGQQFVHYAMTELPLKLAFTASEPEATPEATSS
jgi:hypothetical protein